LNSDIFKTTRDLTFARFVATHNNGPMRDIFEEIFENQPLDPTESARRNMRPKLRTRFYRDATVGEGAEGYPVLLDGRPVRTPARASLAAPVRELAAAIAAEWQAQEDKVDPAAMPLTRLANSIIDGVAPSPEPVAAEIEKYLGTDLLFYRAAGPDGLVASQREHWDPIVEWAQEKLGARFVLVEGVMHVAQPEAAIAAAAKAIPSGANIRESWRLGALDVVTTLTGSALLALALAAGRVTTDEAWTAAHVDEDWNMQFWGRDEVILARRAYRFAEMQAAAGVLAALR
jgi:chaperone required for assembly of F1-ATPase